MTAVLRLWVMSPPSGLMVSAKKSAIFGRSAAVGAAKSQRREQRGVVRVSDGKSVVAENFGRVVFGIEADAQQMSVGERGLVPSCL